MIRSFLLFVCFGSAAVVSAEDTRKLVQVIRYNGGSVNTSTPRFCWHPFEDAEEYRIEIADNPEFGCSYVEFVGDTCFSYDMELDDDVWYWRVSSTDHYLSHSPADSVKVSMSLTTRGKAEKQVPVDHTSGEVYQVNGRRFSKDQSRRAQAIAFIRGTTEKGKTWVGSMPRSFHRSK